MFDIGGWEFLVIVVLAIVVIGPKELPAVLRTVTHWVRKARALARDFQSGLDEIAREAEVDDVQDQIRSGLDLDGLDDAAKTIRGEIEDAVDPTGEIGDAFDQADELLRETPDEEAPATDARRAALAEEPEPAPAATESDRKTSA